MIFFFAIWSLLLLNLEAQPDDVAHDKAWNNESDHGKNTKKDNVGTRSISNHVFSLLISCLSFNTVSKWSQRKLFLQIYGILSCAHSVWFKLEY